MSARVRALLRSLLFALLLLGSRPGTARAEEPVASPPPDAPLVVPMANLSVPALPGSYQHRDLGWMSIAYPPSVYERVRPLIEEAPAFKARLADVLGQSVLDHVEVRIARSADDMAALAPREAPPYSYASGIAYSPLHLVILSLTAPGNGEPTDLESVFRHELFHVALEDAVRGQHVPLWFNEGMAIHESDEHPWLRLQTLWNASLSRTVIPLGDLDRSFPSQHYEVSVAYAESADFLRFLLRDQDRERFTALIERVRGGEPFDRALADAYNVDLRKLEYQWREDMAKRYTFAPMLASGSVLWVVAFAVVGVGYMRKRRRERATIERWEREDALASGPVSVAERPAASRIAVHAADVHGTPSPEGDRDSVALGTAGLPKVEHEGSWHTLH